MLSHFSTIDEAKTAIEENYAGCHERVADLAEELTADATEIPESPAFYIGNEKMARDWEFGCDILTIETRYHILESLTGIASATAAAYLPELLGLSGLWP